MAIFLKSAIGLATLFGAANHFQATDATAPSQPHSMTVQANADEIIRQHALNASPPPTVDFSRIFHHR